MDTQNLKAFLMVAQTHSFSAAAEKLHLTQPAVSKRISLLEQQLDTPLFNRIGRQVSLTQAGHVLFNRASEILRSLDEAQQEINDLQDQVTGRLRLVTSHHIGLHRLPQVLRGYAVKYPKVEIDVQFKDSEDAYRQVLAGEFDLGVISRTTYTDPRIQGENIWKDIMLFVAAPNHPLCHIEPLTLKDIANYPALLPERKFMITKMVEELFRQNSLELDIRLSTNYLETIKALITVGYAWGVLPEIMLEDKLLTKLPVKNMNLQRQLDCIYHKERNLSNPSRAFLNILRNL